MPCRIDPLWLGAGLAALCLVVGLIAIGLELTGFRWPGEVPCPPAHVWVYDTTGRTYCVLGHRVR